jgi:hypothetical protein
MRYGFKAEAKRLALELRAELGLSAHVAFDPYAFAKEYGIEVVALSDLSCSERERFLKLDGSPFSGALIPRGTQLIILENDAQRPSTSDHHVPRNRTCCAGARLRNVARDR